MTLASLLVVLILLGLFLWVLGQLPLDAAIVKIIRVVVIVAAVLYVLAALGWLGPLNVPLGRPLR